MNRNRRQFGYGPSMIMSGVPFTLWSGQFGFGLPGGLSCGSPMDRRPNVPRFDGGVYEVFTADIVYFGMASSGIRSDLGARRRGGVGRLAPRLLVGGWVRLRAASRGDALYRRGRRLRSRPHLGILGDGRFNRLSCAVFRRYDSHGRMHRKSCVSSLDAGCSWIHGVYWSVSNFLGGLSAGRLA